MPVQHAILKFEKSSKLTTLNLKRVAKLCIDLCLK